MGGYDPYSSSKGCAELVTSSYRNSFFNPKKYSEHKVALASVRAGNVIGGGDWGTDRLLPDIIRGFQNKSIIKIRNPEAIRPWQFVLDPLFGYLKLAEKMWDDGVKFLKNHVGDLVSIDFFTVPTARFQVLFCFLLLSHDRRRVLLSLSETSSAPWLAVCAPAGSTLHEGPVGSAVPLGSTPRILEIATRQDWPDPED